MVDQSARAYRVLSAVGLALMSVIIALWATTQAVLQIGGLLAGAPLISAFWLLLSYTVVPLSGVAIAWWCWSQHRHAQAWASLLFIGAALQFLMGPVAMRWQ